MGLFPSISPPAMKTVLLLLLLSLLCLVRAELNFQKKLWKSIDLYNFRSKCWGEKNMDTWIKSIEEAKTRCLQMEPMLGLSASLFPPQATNPFSVQSILSNNPFLKLQNEGDLSKLSSLWRTKRQSGSGLYEVDEEDLYELLLQFQDFKGDMVTNIGNLTLSSLRPRNSLRRGRLI